VPLGAFASNRERAAVQVERLRAPALRIARVAQPQPGVGEIARY
jgi:hypothetical protein